MSAEQVIDKCIVEETVSNLSPDYARKCKMVFFGTQYLCVQTA